MEGAGQPPCSGTQGEEREHGRTTSKKHSHKTKVWDKVTWFSKKPRHKSQTGSSCDVSSEGPLSLSDDECSSLVSRLTPNTYRSALSSDSSYEMEYDDEQGRSIKRSKLYPNSEVVEQSCLKPSIAKALFMQLESVHLGSDCKPKYAFHQQTKNASCHKYLEDDKYLEDNKDFLLYRTVSMPHEIVGRSKCHCIACCGCSPRERLNGECPVYRRRRTSTTSLDRGLDDFQISGCCDLEELPDESIESKPATLPKPTKETELRKLSSSNVLAVKSNNIKSDDSQEKYCEQCHKLKLSKLKSNSERSDATKNLPCAMKPATNLTVICQCTLSESQRDAGSQAESSSIAQPMTLLTPSADVPNLILSPMTDSSKRRSCDISGDSFYDIPCSPSKFKEKADEVDCWFSGLTDEKKNAMLMRLLDHCGVPQKHILCEALKTESHPYCPPNCQDRIAWLPHSLVLHIFSYLEPVSLGRASGVCKVWYNLANEPSLWRKLCSLPKWKLSMAGEQKQILYHMMPNGDVAWKKVFAERFHLINNWLHGRCTVRTFEGHMQGISCVQFDDTRIVSGSSDKTIKVWNIRTNSPWSVQTLVGHSGTVRCLHLQGNRLVSGSTDTTIKVWDLSTQHSWSSIACKVTMVGHTDTVRCLQVDDEKVISGSYDKTLKLWNVRTGRCKQTLRGHQEAVLCVRFDHSKIVSGSCDKTIKVWKFNGTCVMTLQGHHDAVTCLQFDSQRIISGSLDCNLKFWDIHTGQCNNTIDWKASEGHTGVVRCLQADSWRIVSASDDRTLKVWNLETAQRLVTLRNHTDGVTCLQFNDSVIVSGSYDKTVKLWDFGSV